MSQLERVGISLDKQLLTMFDQLIDAQGYQNRSEAIRDLIRDKLDEEELGNPETQAVAGVFLVYDHHTSGLTDKLNHMQHDHLLNIVASVHVHLDHHNCLEIIICKGKAKDIQKFSNAITALKGVKLSRVNMMSTGENLA